MNAKNKAIEKKKEENKRFHEGLKRDIEVGWNKGKPFPNEASYKSVNRHVDKVIKGKSRL